MPSISSVTSPAPLKPVQAYEAPKPPAKPDDDSRAAKPPAQAALPPGQGTRVNIFA